MGSIQEFVFEDGEGNGHKKIRSWSNALQLSPLSEIMWREKPGTEVMGGDVPRALLTWQDLSVSVTNGLGEVIPILHNLTGYADSGQILAIMGPSGSGKSTLLDSLAGRLSRNADQSGNIRVNGRERQLTYGTAGYVTQDDTLIGTLTVHETVTYTAQLRLPNNMSKDQKSAVVNSTIAAMGLQDAVHTPVGNWHLRGLSGGEKRRVSIALEVLTRPRILFLDEPTSGLDSASAFFVVKALRSLSRDGRTVVASIHQPSSEVFALFDNLFLLSSGHTVYFGQGVKAKEHFEVAGYPCPPFRNPSDHFLRAINSDFDRVNAIGSTGGIAHSYQNEDDDILERVPTSEVVERLISTYQGSEAAMWASSKVHEFSNRAGSILESKGSQAGFWMQSYTLTRRSFQNMSRDMGYYWLRLAMYIGLSVCIGTIYYNVGYSYTSIMARAACISYVAGFLTFMSIGAFPSFVEDMKVFTRERLNGHYGVGAFVIGNTLSSIPFLFLIALVSTSIFYFMVGLHPGIEHFVYFALSLFACLLVVESLMMAVAAIVPNYLMGIITGAGIQGIYLLVSGFFRLPHDLPTVIWRYPMMYIGFHMYALQGMYENDFIGSSFSSATPGAGEISGDLIMTKMYQITTRRSKWWNLAILFTMAIGYRVIFLSLIKLLEIMGPTIQRIISLFTARFNAYQFVGTKSVQPVLVSPMQSYPSMSTIVVHS